MQQERENDPLTKFESYLIREKIQSADDIDTLKKEIKLEVDQTAEAADGMAHPSPESVTNYIFAPEAENDTAEYNKDTLSLYETKALVGMPLKDTFCDRGAVDGYKWLCSA